MSVPSKPIRAVGVLFEDEGGNVLVLRRHPASPEGGKWGLPGGKIEEGEESLEAAIREVREEICHDQEPSRLAPLRRYEWSWDGEDVRFEVFKATVRRSEIAIELNLDESTEFRWDQPAQLARSRDLMNGLYPILEDEYSGC